VFLIKHRGHFSLSPLLELSEILTGNHPYGWQVGPLIIFLRHIQNELCHIPNGVAGSFKEARLVVKKNFVGGIK